MITELSDTKGTKRKWKFQLNDSKPNIADSTEGITKEMEKANAFNGANFSFSTSENIPKCCKYYRLHLGPN